MRKRLALVLMTTLLLLCACTGGQDEERFETWRRSALAGEIRCTAEITAVGGGRECAFRVDCRCAGGGTTMTLTAPELIAGVGIRCDESGGELLYDGAVLSLGSVTKSGLSPCAAIPWLMEALERGGVVCLGREDGCLTAELALDGAETARIYLDGESMEPRSAELTEEGRTVVFIRFTSWTMGETENGQTQNEDLGGDISARAGA